MKNLSIFSVFFVMLFAVLACNTATDENTESNNDTGKDSTAVEITSQSDETTTERYRDLNELDEYAGYLNGEGSTIDDNFAIAIYFKEENPTEQLIVFQKIHRLEDGKVEYSNVDTKAVTVPENHVLTGYGAFLNDASAPEIIGIYGPESDVEYFTKIKQAWRANRNTLIIEDIDSEGIKIENPGYGI